MYNTTTKSNLTQTFTGALRLAPPRATPGSKRASPRPRGGSGLTPGSKRFLSRIPSSSSRKGKKNQSSIIQSRHREKEGTISPCSSVMHRSLPRPRSSVLRPPWSAAVVSHTLLFHAYPVGGRKSSASSILTHLQPRLLPLPCVGPPSVSPNRHSVITASPSALPSTSALYPSADEVATHMGEVASKLPE